jgi:hypothetical protein
MKNFRISLAAFALLFAMIAATAFRTAKNDQQTSLTKVWFSFKTNATDPLDPISYFNTAPQPVRCVQYWQNLRLGIRNYPK